jgi:multidrug resistance efflux pump
VHDNFSNMIEKKSIEDPDQIELRSEEVKEILSRPPAWLVRWGTTMFFTVLAVLILISWLLKYPEVVRDNRIVLTTQNPPSLIVPRSSGPLVAMLVSDRQGVSQGEILAVIENPADYMQVMELKKSLLVFENGFDEKSIRNYSFSSNAKLGELQPEFAALTKSMTDLRHFYGLKFHERKIESFRNEASGHIKHLEILKQQKELLKTERELVYKQFKRDSSLYERGVISESAFEMVKAELLKKDQDMENSGVNISSVEITLLQLEQSILQMELDYRNSLNQLQISFSEAYEKISGQLSWWEQKYILRATKSGVVGFSEYWSPGQQVREGLAVFVVIPDNEGELLGRLSLPLARSGKVKEGQKVLVKLANFPHMEYGMLTGKVSSVSLVPSQDQYMVEVIFPEGMRTNYGVDLPFSQEMQGTAEIITEDLRLIQRILNPLRSVIQRNRTL